VSDDMYLVFVYGTLKRAGSNNAILERGGAEFMGEGVTRDASFTMTSPHTFPYVHASGTFQIRGELYKVDRDTKQDLDYIEGYPNHYNLMDVAVVVDGVEHSAAMYYNERPPSRWAEHVTTRDNIQEWVLNIKLLTSERNYHV